jgi:hypothetical protein
MACSAAQAQEPVLAADAPAQAFQFASVAQARAILGARDAYVRATAPLERSAKMHTTEAVDEERYARYMAGAALAWSDEDRRLLQPFLSQIAPLLPSLRWRRDRPILLVKAAPDFEDGLPHTRANAIVLPQGSERVAAGMLIAIMAHELFHVLSRDDAKLKERLYAEIGFKPCASLALPPVVAVLRVTNPDAPEHRHTIAVRWRGQPVEAMPFPSFPSASIDPREGFKSQVRVLWLLVDREGAACKARAPEAGPGPEPENLEGLFEQVGRNTRYLWHPEEILADNFALLLIGMLRGAPLAVPSPEVQERLRKVLLVP